MRNYKSAMLIWFNYYENIWYTQYPNTSYSVACIRYEYDTDKHCIPWLFGSNLNFKYSFTIISDHQLLILKQVVILRWCIMSIFLHIQYNIILLTYDNYLISYTQLHILEYLSWFSSLTFWQMLWYHKQ